MHDSTRGEEPISNFSERKCRLVNIDQTVLREIYNAFLHTGAFLEALNVREALLEHCVKSSNKANWVRHDLDQGLWRKARATLSLREKDDSGNTARFLDRLLDIAPSRNDIPFNDFIKDRPVVILGPGRASKPTIDDISHFDIAVQINAYGSQQIENTNSAYIRRDIVYYNSLQHEHVKRAIETGILDQNWTVFKSEKMKEVFNRKLKCRSCIRPEDIFPFGQFNMLPLILFDLLQFQPSSISCINFDLYLGGYRSNYMHPTNASFTRSEHIRTSMIVHDPFQQLHFLQSVKKVCALTGDRQFRRVLEMSDEQYADELQASIPGPANQDFS